MPAASIAAGQEPSLAHWRIGRYTTDQRNSNRNHSDYRETQKCVYPTGWSELRPITQHQQPSLQALLSARQEDEVLVRGRLKRRQDLGCGQTASTDHDFSNYGWSWHERRNCSRSSSNNGVLPQFPITSASSGDPHSPPSIAQARQVQVFNAIQAVRRCRFLMSSFKDEQ